MIGLVLAAILGAGGFYAVRSGMILSKNDAADQAQKTEETAQPLPDVAFVPVPPIVVNVGAEGEKRFLRFKAQLEVAPEAEQEVADLVPRIVDVLNGYLRAIDTGELERKAVLVRIRAQMLRRIQVITGEGRVHDLLVMEFVLN